MIQKVVEEVSKLFESLKKQETFVKGQKVEMVGEMINPKENISENVIVTIQVHSYIPHSSFGEPGEKHEERRKRKLKDKTGEWYYRDEIVTRYEMSPADKKFIYFNYVYFHLTAEQLNLLSGIPQPYIFRYIKAEKLKPIYEEIPKSERKTLIDFDKPFHLDPYPTRSEWKARREDLGLQNGENWRGTPVDENPGERRYGNGKTSAKKKLSKLNRKEARKKENIQKYNKNQNNRYGITEDHPEGTKDPYKEYRDSLEKKIKE
jgi:hypothetical protein